MQYAVMPLTRAAPRVLYPARVPQPTGGSAPVFAAITAQPQAASELRGARRGGSSARSWPLRAAHPRWG